MKKRHIAFFIITILAGAAAHFVYGWTGGSVIAALFCPVNESVWEHLKLLAAPFLLLSAVEYAVSKKKSPNFFAAKALALWAGMAVIVFGFYTYTGVLGQDWLPADIALFVAGAAAAWLCSHRLLSRGSFSSGTAKALGLAAIGLAAACFFAFTFAPPKIPLFRDPPTGTFGIPQS